MRIRLLVLATLLAAVAAQVIDYVEYPSGVSDLAFPVTLNYSGFEALYTGQMGMIVSLNTALGDYLSDGKLSLGTGGSGVATVYVMPPVGFLVDNIGLNVTLRAFVIKYTDILQNVSTAYTYALKDANLTGVPVIARPSYGTAGQLKFMGVDLGGGEAGAKYDSTSAYYFRRMGFNFFGLFTSWSRLVPNILTGNLKSSEVTSLYNAVDYITNKLGAFCSLELHDYGRYTTDAIGLGQATPARFQSVWSNLANLFKNNSRVIFSLMNEPHDQSNSDYVSALNTTVAAIRQTGATNMIMIQGNRWNSAMNWLDVDEWGASDTETMITVVDPLGNMFFNIHQYVDASHGGSFDGCISANIGSQYLSAVTQWLRRNNKKAILGEFGASNDSVCASAINDMLTYVEANSDVWMGWSWWTGGVFESDCSYTIEPTTDANGNYVADGKQAWLTSHMSVKCPATYKGSASTKSSSCLILNGVEGTISADANSSAPTDSTGTGGTKAPGKVVKLNPNSAVSFNVNEPHFVALLSMLLVLLVL